MKTLALTVKVYITYGDGGGEHCLTCWSKIFLRCFSWVEIW